MVELASNFIAAASVILAIVALIHSRRANREAREANHISREANTIAEQATKHAARAVELQENQGVLRLRVEPRITVCAIGDGRESWIRPVVRVVNLSAFPVTIDEIHWEHGLEPNGQFKWPYMTVTGSTRYLPVRIPPRGALTAYGTESAFANLRELAAVTAAVAHTACGERVTGMTDDWKSQVRRILAENESDGEAAEMPAAEFCDNDS